MRDAQCPLSRSRAGISVSEARSHLNVEWEMALRSYDGILYGGRGMALCAARKAEMSPIFSAS
jgi:hypothetical protein